MNKAQQNLIEFAKKYPGKWHSFAMDLETTQAVCGLANMKLIRVNKYRQFKGCVGNISQYESAQEDAAQEGTEGQDRKSYTDNQDRDNYHG